MVMGRKRWEGYEWENGVGKKVEGFGWEKGGGLRVEKKVRVKDRKMGEGLCVGKGEGYVWGKKGGLCRKRVRILVGKKGEG